MAILNTFLLFVVQILQPENVHPLKIINQDSISIIIGWDIASGISVEKYEIYRSKYRLLKTLFQDTIYIDYNIKPDNEYLYDVVKKEIMKEYNHQKNFLKVVSIGYQVIKDTTNNRNIIKWKRPNDLYLGETYEIWRAENNGDYEIIGSVSARERSFRDTTMKDGVKYFYKVAAVNGNERAFSNPSPLVFTIGTPKFLYARDIPNDEGEGFRITWEPSPNYDMIKGYALLRLVYDSIAAFKDTFTFTDTTIKPGIEYHYYIGKNYQITMPAKIVSDSVGMTGRVIKIEWKLNPKVIGQNYDLTLIYRAKKDSSDKFQYVDYTYPDEDKFIDGTAETDREYIYEARAVKEVSIPFKIEKDTCIENKRFISLSWKKSKEPPEFLGYYVMRAEKDSGNYGIYARLGTQVTTYQDRLGIFNNVPYTYRIVAVTKDGEKISSETTPYVVASPQWFHTGRINALIGIIIFIFLVIFFIEYAKKEKDIFVRRIAGLSAIDEAVGRATEMGRPILYVPGTSVIDDVATIASLNILAEVAKKTAQYNTPLIVPNRDPIVYTVAREVVKESYNKVGRPDAFNPDSVYFVTDSQFAYAAAVSGIMIRERPATNFLVGMFWAESLIMAESGASTGAIQIAGTDAVTQLPFFITACDYTLIGEELYAASAYISRNPTLLAALKSQDYSKLVIVGVLIIATILALLKIGIPVFNLFNIQ
uniref:Fibronectin type III domain-containing protein n=1 Tax=candidate division WOR-3 bacterium TaxID=2052148 RepID=A0A7C4TC74_UNCW3